MKMDVLILCFDRYSTPYVGGRLILENNGFGLGFEGAPGLTDCVR